MADAFISYKSGNDALYVRLLRSELQLASQRTFKGSVFLDVDILPPGSDWADELEHYIARAKTLVVSIGEGWISRVKELERPKDWVRKEIMLAETQNKVIIPVFLGDEVSRAFRAIEDEIPRDLWSVLETKQFSVFDKNSDRNDAYRIAMQLADAPKQYDRNRVLAALNGLVGVLKLVHQNMSSQQHFAEAKNLLRQLTPLDYLVSEDGESLLDNYGQSTIDWVFSLNTIADSPLNATNPYARAVIGNLQIDIALFASSFPITLVLFEKQLSASESKILLIEYRFNKTFADLSRLELLMGEPAGLLNDEFRFPYQSIFHCYIHSSTNQPQHSYKPQRADNQMNSYMFARLFENGWIGSQLLDRSQIDTILNTLRQENPMPFTLIHAIESEIE